MVCACVRARLAAVVGVRGGVQAGVRIWWQWWWWWVVWVGLCWVGGVWGGVRGRRWARTLMRRMDPRGCVASNEFAALVANVDMWCKQMYCVHRRALNVTFHRGADDAAYSHPRELSNAVLSAGECCNIGEALRGKKKVAHVTALAPNTDTL